MFGFKLAYGYELQQITREAQMTHTVQMMPAGHNDTKGLSVSSLVKSIAQIHKFLDGQCFRTADGVDACRYKFPGSRGGIDL